MQDAQIIIERVRRVSAAIQQLDLAVELPHRTVQPGQFFLARVTESFDPYLREPWIPIRKRANIVTVERPVWPTYQPGQVVNLLGPLGTPFTLRNTARTLLLIAYDATPAALLMLAEQAIQSRVSVTLALVGSAQSYPLETLAEEIEVVRGDDKGHWIEQKDNIEWADQIVAVATMPDDFKRYHHLMESIRKVRTEVPKGYAVGFFQPPMPCGIGACGACLIRCHRQEQYACTEGPAFDLLDLSLG